MNFFLILLENVERRKCESSENLKIGVPFSRKKKFKK
jgi:hypothetical protein